MRSALAYPHLAARLFNTPLLLAPDKAEVIVAALRPRLLGLEGPALVAPGPHDGEQRRGFDVTDSGVAVIPVSGTLVRRHDFMSAASGLTSYDRIRGMIEDAVTDPRVQGLLLDIDSPGGEVAGLFDLVDFLGEARTLKPLWAAANDQAYSAAYDLAAAAERVYVTQTGGVGSVGVIAIHLDASKADEMEGLRHTVFRAGKYKAEHNSYEPLTDHARQTMQAELDRLQGLFAAQVARNRGLTVDQVLGQEAQVYRGPAGIDQRLADQVGTLDQALADLEARIRQQERSPRWPGMVTAAAGATHAQEDPMPPETEQTTTTPPAVDATPVLTSQEPEAASPAGQVIDLEEARASARLEERDYQRQVRELCRLAGHAELAEGFIDRQLSPAAVGRALLERQAEDDEAAQVTSVADPAAATEPGPAALDVVAVYAQRNEAYHRRLAGQPAG